MEHTSERGTRGWGVQREPREPTDVGQVEDLAFPLAGKAGASVVEIEQGVLQDDRYRPPRLHGHVHALRKLTSHLSSLNPRLSAQAGLDLGRIDLP